MKRRSLRQQSWSSVFTQNRPRKGVLVKISSNRVGTRKPSTHLWIYNLQNFILALVLLDDDIARYFKPNTLCIRWTLAHQCELLKTVTRMQ